MLVAVVHKSDRARSARIENRVIDIIFGNARPIKGVDCPIQDGCFRCRSHKLVDFPEWRSEQMPFFAVDFFKNGVRLFNFPFKGRKIKRSEIKMRLGVIA